MVMTVLLCGFGLTSARGQFIQQLRLLPTQPVDNLPVQVIADLFLPSSGCPLEATAITQTSPNRFEANALHCVGILTVICSTSDTFDLGVLPAGNYRFVLREEYGWLPSPCTAGTQPPAIDSIDFQVTVSSGLADLIRPQVVLTPNPTDDGFFFLRSDIYMPGLTCRIMDPAGRLLLVQPVQSVNQQIDLSAFADGVFFVELWLERERVYQSRLVKH